MTRLGSATRETFRSLRARNFRLFFGGQLISQVGNWLTMVALTLLVFRITNSGVALGALAACQFGPVLIFGPWAGLVADRSDKRHLLLIVQAIAMLQSFALGALAFSDHPSVSLLYAVALIGGFTTAFDNPARRAFVVEMVPDEDVNNAVSLNSAVMTSARVVGPALAGLLITTVGFGWAFVADGVSYIAVLWALWAIRPSELHSSVRTVRGRGQVREGLRYVLSIRELWVPLVMMTIIGTLAFNFQVVFPLFVTRDLGGDDTTFTILLSVVSVGSLVGALATARRREIDIRIVSLSAIAFGFPLIGLALAPNVGLALFFGVLLGMGSIAFLTSSTAIVQVRAMPSMRGRVLALQAMVFLGTTPIGGPILGAICDAWGARWGIAIGAVGCLAAGAWGVAMSRRDAIDPASVLTAPATSWVTDDGARTAVVEATDELDQTAHPV